MTLDMHITLGELIIAGTTIVSVTAAYFRLSERLLVLETKVGDLWDRRSRPRD